jgi:mono/diheme cytochrome c family protein
MLRIVAAGLTAGSVVLAWAAAAQDLGDSKRGHVLAETVCSECHAIDKGAPRSRNGNAPTFQSLANTRGMTATALRVALRTPHQQMPNLVLKDQEIDDVIAYLQTLK